MNQSKSQELQNNKSKSYGILLQSWALGTMIAWKATRILDAENLKEWKFIRCEVSNQKPAWYGRDIKTVDIPEIAIQKAIKYWSVWTWTRAIVSDGSAVWDRDTVKIESYNHETHELHVIWQFSGRFTLKIPVSYTHYNNTKGYFDLGNNMRPNPTQPKFESILGQVDAFLKR